MKKDQKIVKSKKIIIVGVTISLIVVAVACVILWPTQKVCTSYLGTKEEQCSNDYIGLTSEEASAKSERAGLFAQYRTIDGVSQINVDIGGDLVYFDIKNNIVIRICFDSTMHGWPQEDHPLCYPRTLE